MNDLGLCKVEVQCSTADNDTWTVVPHTKGYYVPRPLHAQGGVFHKLVRCAGSSNSRNGEHAS